MYQHVMSRRSFLASGAASTLSGPAVDPTDLGAVGDGRSNDLGAFKQAIAVAAERGLPLKITRQHYLGLRNASDSIQLKSGAILNFEGGSVRYDYVGSPLFWAKDAKNIEIRNARVEFSGRMPLRLSTEIPTFFERVLQRTSPMPGRELMAAFGFYGIENLKIFSARFEATRYEQDTLIIRCIVVGGHDDGRPSRNIEIQDFHADGFYMGILGWHIDGLTIRGMRCRRWGQLNTAKYAWDCPAHPIYIAPLGETRNVVCTDLIDEGQEVSPWYGAGSTSFKFTGVTDGLRLARLHSRRSAGLLDFHGRNFVMNDLEWAGQSPDAIRANKVIRAIPYAKTSDEFTGGIMRNVRLTFPNEMDDYPVALGWQDGSNVDGCLFDAWNLSVPGDRQSPSTPLILASMSRTTWRDLQISAPRASGEMLAMRIDNGGTGNTVDLHVRSPAHMRVSAAPGNRVQVSQA